MARENLTFLTGIVAKSPTIVKAGDEYQYAMVYLIVSRGLREVGDHRKYMKCDNPIIMTRDPKLIQEIESWNKYDIVHVKGMIASKRIMKSSICKECGMKNSQPGALVYVYPIYAEKIGSVETKEQAVEYLSDHREISNQLYVFGHVCGDPKKIKPKSDLIVTQYQIALTRKFRIRTDSPDIRTDFPWVKSYGDNAEEDKLRLRKGSEVYIDGCLQARSVLRHAICGQAFDMEGKAMFDDEMNPIRKTDANGKPVGCGAVYDWQDRAMEIVPYSTEYLSNYNSDQEIEKNENENVIKKVLSGDTKDEDEITKEDYDNGFDDMKSTES